MSADGFDPNHHFYSPLGEKITLLEWGALFGGDRTLATDVIGEVTIKTMYLGYVDSRDPSARLFGTARQDIEGSNEIQLYDSEQDALLGHYKHVAAVRDGHHCHGCQLHEENPHGPIG
jgi:hypothetical protein